MKTTKRNGGKLAMKGSPSTPSKSMLQHPALQATLLYAAALVLYLFELDRFAFNYLDEGYLYYLADLFGQGVHPYRDVLLYNYLPGVFYLYTPLFQLFGPDIEVARIFTALLMAATPPLFYLAMRQLAPSHWALLMTLPILIAPGAWHKFYVNQLNILLLLTAIATLRSARPGWATGFGAAVGIALLMRIDVGLLGLLLIAMLLVLRERKKTGEILRYSLYIATGLLLIQLPAHLALYGIDALDGYYRQYLELFDRLLQRTGTAGLAPPPLEQLLGVGPANRFTWLYYGSLIPIMVVGLRTLYLGSKSRQEGSLWLFLIWLVGNLPQYLLERPDRNHLLAHSGGILAALLLAAWWGHARFGARARALVLVTTLCYALLLADIGRQQLFAPSETLTRLSNGLEYRGHPGLRPLLERVLAHPNHSPVAAFPYVPGINFLLQRKMPGRHVYMIPRYTTHRLQRELIEDLDDNCFIFYGVAQNVNGHPESDPKQYLSLLNVYIGQHYVEVDSYNGILLFQRKTCLDSDHSGSAAAPKP